MDLLPFAFRLLHQSPRIKQIMAASQPTVDEIRAVWPEAGPLLHDLIKIVGKLIQLFGPAWKAAIEAWPTVQPVVAEIINDIAPEFARQWAKEPQLTPFSVRWLQQSLNQLGASPKLKIDGEMGDATRWAIEQFQKREGLEVDGWAGPVETLPVIMAKLGSPS